MQRHRGSTISAEENRPATAAAGEQALALRAGIRFEPRVAPSASGHSISGGAVDGGPGPTSTSAAPKDDSQANANGRGAAGIAGSGDPAYGAELQRGFSMAREDLLGRDWRRVLETVGGYFGVPIDALLGRARTETVCVARHAAMYVLRLMHPKDVTWTELGILFERDDGTVEYGCIKFQDRLDTTARMRADLEAILNRLGLEGKPAAPSIGVNAEAQRCEERRAAV